MDKTIRNLDDGAFRALRSRAVLEGRPVGELVNEAIRRYLQQTAVRQSDSSLRALEPEEYAVGNERLSMEIDAVAYGERE
jgi:plasmid stability protein